MKRTGEAHDRPGADNGSAGAALDQSAADDSPKQAAPSHAPPQATSQPGKSVQFGVAGLLIFTTGVCILLAALRALGVEYWQLLLGFVLTSAVSLLVILLLELHKHFATQQLAQRQTTARTTESARNPYASPDAPALPARSRTLLHAPVDPTGINFLESEGIEFLTAETPASDDRQDAGKSAPADGDTPADSNAPANSNASAVSRPDEAT